MNFAEISNMDVYSIIDNMKVDEYDRGSNQGTCDRYEEYSSGLRREN